MARMKAILSRRSIANCWIASATLWIRTNKHRGLPSTFQPRAAAYSLEIEHPQTGATTCESYGTLLAVVARAAELIRAGYATGI
jgi:hypothetical protein